MPRTPKSEGPEQKTVIVRVPEEWHEYLRERAFKERRNMTDLVREALRDTFGLSEPPPDEGRKGGVCLA